MTAPLLMLAEARTGSTLFSTLLRNHSQISTLPFEPLDNRAGPVDKPIEKLNKLLEEESSPIIGFKISPEQMTLNKLTARSVVRHCGVKHVIVVWRESCLESFVSLKIASKTRVWCSTKAPEKIERIRVDESAFIQYLNRLERDWRETVRDWPAEIDPIFVKYEDLVSCTAKEMHRALSGLSLDTDGFGCNNIKMQKQNPASLSEKIINFDELSTETRTSSLDIPTIFRETIAKAVSFPEKNEVPVSPNGWQHIISELYQEERFGSSQFQQHLIS